MGFGSSSGSLVVVTMLAGETWSFQFAYRDLGPLSDARICTPSDTSTVTDSKPVQATRPQQGGPELAGDSAGDLHGQA